MKKCVKCGAELKDGAKFCDECGAIQLSADVENTNHSEISNNTTNESNVSVINSKAKKKNKAIIALIILAVLIISFVIILVCQDRKPENMTQKVYDIGIDLLEDVDLCLDGKMSTDRLRTKIGYTYDEIAKYRESDDYPDDGFLDTMGDWSLEMLCTRFQSDKYDEEKIELYQVEQFRDELKEKLGK